MAVPRAPLDRSQEATPLPRLLNLRQAADYVGVSYWAIRDWVAAGHLPTVSLPGYRPREGAVARPSLRRVLIDRTDLDAWIDARKQRAG